MRTNKMRISVLILFLLCLCLSACGEKGEAGPVQAGDPAPDFTATLMDGSSFQLSEQEGKAVLLNFWATWCGPCVGEMPAFTRLSEAYGDKLSLLAVNCGEDKETVERFLSENGYTFPVALDPEGEISALYPTDGIPYTLIIAPDGTLSSVQVGAGDADMMFTHYSEELDKVLE